MIKYLLFTLAAVTFVSCQSRKRVEDPTTMINPFAHTFAYHLWPWNQLIRAVAALDDEDLIEEPQVISDAKKHEINMRVRSFKPDELKVRVKNRYILIEAKHKEIDNEQHFLTNHFVQRFMLPPGSKPEEVKAIYKENGVLTVSVPKHELPPPPPEIVVPIQVIKSEKKPESEESVETTTAKKEEPKQTASSPTPLEQLDLVEATTHVGKIRKKELKTTKTTKDNEVTKGIDSNGLDYALIETEME